MIHHPSVMKLEIPPPPVWRFRVVRWYLWCCHCLVTKATTSLNDMKCTALADHIKSQNPYVRTRIELECITARSSQSRKHCILQQYLNFMMESIRSDLLFLQILRQQGLTKLRKEFSQWFWKRVKLWPSSRMWNHLHPSSGTKANRCLSLF